MTAMLFQMSNVKTTTIDNAGAIASSLNHITSQTREWERENGVETTLRSTTTIFHNQTDSSLYCYDVLSGNSLVSRDLTAYDQSLLRIDREVKELGQSKVTTYFGFGTASGKKVHLAGSKIEQDYTGRIFRDPQTGNLSAKSVATTDSTLAVPQSHGQIAIDYNYFTRFTDANLTTDQNANCGLVFYESFGIPLQCIIPAHTSHHSVVQVDFSGNGVGVTFGEPTQIDAGFFDSGVEKFLTEGETTKPVPMDTSGIPMAGIELGDLIREALEKLEEEFSKKTYEIGNHQ